MDLTFSSELEEFRLQVRKFIEEKCPTVKIRAGVRNPEDDEIDAYRKWGGDLFKAGYMGGHWPVQWGGRADWHALQDVVVEQELARAGSPYPMGAFNLISSALIAYGTEAQQAYYLPRIRSFTDHWCQLFSEPGSGSDLASLKTKARLDGDHWVIDGQKVWTTFGQLCEYGYLLARTDPNVPKHKGISAFMVKMDTPGIDIRPIREITGTEDFCEVFFTSVRIPAASIIGDPGQGWTITNNCLALERAWISSRGIALEKKMQDIFEVARRYRRNGRPVIEDGAARRELAELWARTKICNWVGFLRITHEVKGETHSADAPIGKILFSELNQQMAEYAVGLQGPDALLIEGDADAIDNGRWQDEYLYARGVYHCWWFIRVNA